MLSFWNKKSFYIAKALSENLDGFIKGVMTKNTSAVFIIDGRSGQGKTTLACQVGCYINKKVKDYYDRKGISNQAPEFSLNNLAWTPDTFIEKFENVKKGDIIIFDEAMIISNRSTMSELNRKVIIMMSMIRSKQVFVIFCVNSIFDLDKNLPLHRADMLLSVYPKEKKFASRGAYMCVPAAGGKLKYLYITGKKYYNYNKARPAFTNTFSGFFPFDDNEYEERKQEAVNNYFDKDSTKGKNSAILSRDLYIRYISDNIPSLRQEEIARIGNISPRTVSRAIARTRQ